MGFRPMKSLAVAAILAIAAAVPSRAPAATNDNANTPLGINLDIMSYYDPEQPFLNIMKTTGITQSNPQAWFTRDRSLNETREEAYLQLDADGYPTTLTASSSDPNSPQRFAQVCALILRLPASNAGTGPSYEAGQYVILYDGVGTIGVSLDGRMVSTAQGSSGGRDVFNVATPKVNNGVFVCITSTDPHNHVRNIRVVKAENEPLLAQGQIYTPRFLDLLKNFRAIRALQWLQVINSKASGNWADRSHMTDAGWGSANGVPLEAVIDLCNTESADCWINIPHTATDDYITQMATLVHQQLDSGLKVYVEFSNEVWNPGYSEYHYAASQGQALWPGKTNEFGYYRNWFGMRTAQMCDIWAQVWGGDFSPRVHCVLAAQAANTYTVRSSLDCPLWSGAPCYQHHITDVAIAPYFGWSAQHTPLSWGKMSTASALNEIFAEFNAGRTGGLIPANSPGGAVQEASDWEVAYQKVLAAYHLPLIAYEGGQSVNGFPTYPNGSPVVNAYIAANRDPRMAAVYGRALADWKANGGRLYMLYNDITSAGKYGEWGLLESFMDTVSPLSSAPPKWQAVQNFMSNNPCWWSGCSRSISQVPLAPAGFKASP